MIKLLIIIIPENIIWLWYVNYKVVQGCVTTEDQSSDRNHTTNLNKDIFIIEALSNKRRVNSEWVFKNV